MLSFSLSAAAGISALFSSRWVRSVNWPRAAALFLGGMLLANTLGLAFHGYGLFTALQGLSGFTSSAAFALGMTMLSDQPQAARGFGLATGLQVVYQVCTLFVGPWLLRHGGMNAILVLLALPCGLAMLLTPLIPAHGRTITPGSRTTSLFAPATALAIAAFGAWFVNVGGYWTYVELIGESRGMNRQVIANSMATGLLGGVVGGGLAWLMAERFGRFKPIAVSAVLTVGSALLLAGTDTVAAFVISAFVYVFAWNYSWAYLIEQVNAVDASGKGVAVVSAFGFIGTAIGAGLAALFVSPGNYRSVIWLEILGVGMSVLLFALSRRVHGHRVTTLRDSTEGMAS